MKFDGYIYFFSEEGGGDCVLVLHKKRKKDEKGEKKNQEKVFKMGHLWQALRLVVSILYPK